METEREEYGDDSELIAPEEIDLSLDRDSTWLLTSSIGPCAGNLHIKVTCNLRRHDNLLKYASKNVQVQLCETFTAARRCETSAESRFVLHVSC